MGPKRVPAYGSTARRLDERPPPPPRDAADAGRRLLRGAVDGRGLGCRAGERWIELGGSPAISDWKSRLNCSAVMTRTVRACASASSAAATAGRVWWSGCWLWLSENDV